MNIWVTGKTGQLGSEIAELAKKENANYIFSSREDLNLASLDQVKAFAEKHNVDAVINCAAYTAVDLAEDEKDLAALANDTAVANLVQVCEERDMQLVHISTDYVFDGSATTPIKPHDAVKPIGVYGVTKLAGEQHVRNANIKAVIIRTAWVFSAFGNNFVKTMRRLGADRDALNVVGDQYGQPTYAKDLAEVCVKLIGNIQKNEVYHFSNHGKTSWAEFAAEIMKQSGLNCAITAIPSSEYPTKAERPKYSVLDTSSLEADYNIEIRSWQSALKEMLKAL